MAKRKNPKSKKKRAVSSSRWERWAWKKNIIRVLVIIGVFLALGLVFSLVQVNLLRWIDPPFSAFMLRDRLIHGSVSPLHLDWTSLEAITPNMMRSVMAGEDQRFFEHQGFDWREIKNAVRDGMDGKGLRGASTISMQVARNMFLWPDRSMFRKGLEIYYTVLLEAFLSKKRILEIYLNVAEFGPHLYGITAASKRYFNRSPGKLSAQQCAGLAYVLPAPSTRSPHDSSSYAGRRKRFIRRHMKNMVLPKK